MLPERGSDADHSESRRDADARVAIERAIDLGARNEDATRIEKVIREEDTPTAYGARWLAACGNPDYRSAFLPWLPIPRWDTCNLIQPDEIGPRSLAPVARGERRGPD